MDKGFFNTPWQGGFSATLSFEGTLPLPLRKGIRGLASRRGRASGAAEGFNPPARAATGGRPYENPAFETRRRDRPPCLSDKGQLRVSCKISRQQNHPSCRTTTKRSPPLWPEVRDVVAFPVVRELANLQKMLYIFLRGLPLCRFSTGMT